jgi:hypothetical protein
MNKLKSVLYTIVFLGATVTIFASVIALPRYIFNISAEEKIELHKHQESRYQILNRQARLKNNALSKSSSPDPSVTNEIAFGIALRLIGDSNTDAEKQLMRKYMANNLGVTNISDQNLLFQISEEYKRNSNLLQMNAENITRKYHPTHSTISNADDNKIKKLGKDKEKLVKDAVRDLMRDMSSSSWTSFETAVIERIKPNIKANVH